MMRRVDVGPLHSCWAPRGASTLMTLALLLTGAALFVFTPAAFAASFSADFLPHGFCYLWNSRLLSLHLVSDLLIGLSYVGISLTLWYIARKFRRQLPFTGSTSPSARSLSPAALPTSWKSSYSGFPIT